jgi:SAM-dependent methyltransferase
VEKRTDWYAHPEYYEAIFDADTEREIDFLLGLNARFGNGGKRWIEPACGAGRLLEAGAKRGLTVHGSDLSRPMLERARQRLTPTLRRRVTVAEGAMESYAPPKLRGKFDLAYSLVSTFRYLTSEAAALGHLRCVRSLLADGGVYVLGFHLTDYAREVPERERWVAHVDRRQGEKDRVVCNTQEGLPDPKTRLSPMRNRLRVSGPGKDWLIETNWHFRTYDARQAARLFTKAGLCVKARFDFDYDLTREKPEANRLDQIYVLGT